MTNPGIVGPSSPDRLSGLRTPSSATYSANPYGAVPAWDPSTNAYVLNRGAKFNPVLSAYNLTAQNMGLWLNAYARQRQGTRQAKVTFLGDSTTHGAVGATPFSTNSAAGQLKTYIDGLTGNTDVGWGHVPIFDAGNSSGDVRITGSVGGSAATAWAVGQFKNIGASPVTDYIQLNIPTGTVIDTVDVSIAKGFGASSIPVDVDGVAATAITATGSGVGTGTYTVTAGSAHTITVHTGVGGNTWLAGFIARKNATTGVLVNKIGFSGAGAEYAIQNPSGLPAQSYYLSTVGGDLFVIKTGINTSEYPNSSGELPGYKAAMTSIVANFITTGSVVLVTPTPVTANIDNPVNRYPAMVRTLYRLADELNVPLIDLQHRWNSNYSANTSSFTTSIHTDQFGYRDESATYFHALIDSLVR